jgi:hypothetical protein
MAKVTDQTVPTELQELFYALTSPGKLTQGADGDIKIKRNKKKPNKEPAPDLDLLAFKRLATTIADERPDALNGVPRATFIYNLTRDLILGNFDPEYWEAVEEDDATTFVSTPSSIPDPDPPPYGYRTPLFLPTIPTYPDGTPTDDPPGFFGEKETGYFVDRYLVWRKVFFKPQALSHAAPISRCVMLWETVITMDASSRGSRPMLSLHARATLCRSGAPDLTEAPPPTEKKTIFYWRFRMPNGGPPYYFANAPRRIVKPLSRFALIQGAGDNQSFCITAANRPMLGRGFNNNDFVRTSFDSNPKLYALTTCGKSQIHHWSAPLKPFTLFARCSAYSKTLDRYVLGCSGYFAYRTGNGNWNYVNAPLNVPIWSIVYADDLGLFVAVGSTPFATGIFTSTNGFSWAQRPTSNDPEWKAVAYSKKLHRFVALGFNHPTLKGAYSDDGINWTAAAGIDNSAGELLKWVSHLSLFINLASKPDGQGFAYSADGISWQKSFLPHSADWKGWAFDPITKRAVATGIAGSQSWVMTSPDCLSWTEQQISPSFGGLSVTWVPPRREFFFTTEFTNGKTPSFSADGVTHTPFSPTTDAWLTATYWNKHKCHLFTIEGHSSPYNLRTTLPPDP